MCVQLCGVGHKKVAVSGLATRSLCHCSAQAWLMHGGVLVEYWFSTVFSTGGVLVQYCFSTGGVLFQYWPSTGPVLVQYCYSTDTVLVQYWPQYWSSTGPVLAQYWHSNGITIEKRRCLTTLAINIMILLVALISTCP